MDARYFLIKLSKMKIVKIADVVFQFFLVVGKTFSQSISFGVRAGVSFFSMQINIPTNAFPWFRIASRTPDRNWRQVTASLSPKN